ncbi:aminoglycoside 3'-phosphotransferase [Paenibacillus sp. J2TS4]|uniref:aminoglycoside 3'-phosphotransferase n=1 Tax=Paenibacillus sp. J2TS4 TaxID=2807194 RepID=UPI001B0AB4A7|nr:aminoglycoside 3'-phosphotransferase [Paenibacillus sp. J2TS4]GIP33649.1 aminoglycoside phosphotransferase APH(3') [Paenibacillus sp. J2TS4]
MLDIGLLPQAIRRYTEGSDVSALKLKGRSSVYHIAGSDGAYCLKIAHARERLQREADMLRFLAEDGLAPESICFESDREREREYLLMEVVPGHDATDNRYLANPAKLCETFAESLTRLHSLKTAGCPTVNGLEDMVRRAEDNFRNGRCDRSLLRYLECADPAAAFDELTAIVRHVSWDKGVVIHGDYCLPNVMLQHWRLSGFIDVGYGGVGDPHYDLFWGMWSLQFNLEDVRWAHRFLEAYGRHLIDPDRQRLCGLISAFNGFRGQDYYTEE